MIKLYEPKIYKEDIELVKKTLEEEVGFQETHQLLKILKIN